MTDLALFNGESWELLIRRWAKLEKDFKMKNDRFDISKIPDIYDCIKYDLQVGDVVDRVATNIACSPPRTILAE